MVYYDNEDHDGEFDARFDDDPNNQAGQDEDPVVDDRPTDEELEDAADHLFDDGADDPDFDPNEG